MDTVKKFAEQTSEWQEDVIVDFDYTPTGASYEVVESMDKESEQRDSSWR